LVALGVKRAEGRFLDLVIGAVRELAGGLPLRSVRPHSLEIVQVFLAPDTFEGLGHLEPLFSADLNPLLDQHRPAHLKRAVGLALRVEGLTP